jgi:hypothetical protein
MINDTYVWKGEKTISEVNPWRIMLMKLGKGNKKPTQKAFHSQTLCMLFASDFVE